MKKKEFIAFVLSLLTHFCLCAILLYTTKPNVESPSKDLDVEWVTLRDQHLSAKKTPKNADSKLKTQGARKFKQLNLDHLKPTLYSNNYDGGRLSFSSESRGEWSDQPVMETLNNMDLFEYSQNHSFFEVLAINMNQAIKYPEDFARNMLVGKFWIRIFVDRKGRLLQIIESSKSSPLLQAYVMINLYQSLKKPLPKKYWYHKDKDLAFQLNFDFSVSSVASMPSLSSVKYQKNSIHFKRREKIPNFLQRFSHDYARYLPPIVPTPLGPVINFVQVYKMIESWQGLDPIQRRKLGFEMTREKMEHMLKIETEKHRQ